MISNLQPSSGRFPQGLNLNFQRHQRQCDCWVLSSVVIACGCCCPLLAIIFAALGPRASRTVKVFLGKLMASPFLQLRHWMTPLLERNQKWPLCFKEGGKLKSEIAADFEQIELLHKELPCEERTRAHEFFLTLASCNTVIPILPLAPSSMDVESDSSVAIDYPGESPEEQALVAATSTYGYTLFEWTSGHIVIDVNGEK